MEFEFILLSSPLGLSIVLALPGDVAYACTNIQRMWHKKKRKKKKTLHILTHGAMRGCGLTSLVVCSNDKICDIRSRNVTIRSEI